MKFSSPIKFYALIAVLAALVAIPTVNRFKSSQSDGSVQGIKSLLTQLPPQPTSYPRPSYYPQPSYRPTSAPVSSPLSCRYGVTNFSVDTPCTDLNSFSYVNFSCTDGYKIRDGGLTSCKTLHAWVDYAVTTCRQHQVCPTPRPTLRPSYPPYPSYRPSLQPSFYPTYTPRPSIAPPSPLIFPTKTGCIKSPAYAGDGCSGYRLITSTQSGSVCHNTYVACSQYMGNGTCVKSPVYPGDTCIGYRVMPGISRSCYSYDQCIALAPNPSPVALPR